MPLTPPASLIFSDIYYYFESLRKEFYIMNDAQEILWILSEMCENYITQEHESEVNNHATDAI